jgi:hypothetical protein
MISHDASHRALDGRLDQVLAHAADRSLPTVTARRPDDVLSCRCACVLRLQEKDRCAALSSKPLLPAQQVGYGPLVSPDLTAWDAWHPRKMADRLAGIDSAASDSGIGGPRDGSAVGAG